MRPIPAHRIGHAHGLLRALDQRGRLRLDEFVTDFAEADLFPADAESDTGRTRQYLSYAGAAGLIVADRGTVELTDLGRRYIRAGDPADVWSVSPGQAEWLRRQLREKHLTPSIWNGAAIGLSLYATLRPGERVALRDFGRAAAHLGRAGWDNENTFRSQGERFTRLLQDMELLGPDGRVTPVGEQTKAELRLPVHVGLKELAVQLNPGGPAAVDAEAAADWPGAAPPAPGPVAPPPGDPLPALDEGTGEWLEVGAQSPEPVAPAPEPAAPAIGPIEAAALAATPAPAPPAPPAPDFRVLRPTQAVTALRPEDIAAWQAQQEQEPPPATGDPPAGAGAFLDLSDVRAVAERRGLVLDDGVYAAAIAALASGRHLVLTGGAGQGKTTLALALAEAAARQGRCAGVTFTSAGGRLGSREMLGRLRRATDGGGAFEPGLVPRTIGEGRWLVLDELDRTDLDRALGRVSTVLGGHPVDLPGGGELAPPEDWRVIATMADLSGVARTSAALRRRFVFVEVPVLERAALDDLVARWAGGDAVAEAVGRRLVAVSDVVALGPGLYADAIAYVRARRRLAPADEAALTLEALAGFVLPQLEGMDDELAGRAVAAAGLA
ncbi:MAG TPA: AAA family ATPase [Solirubrobacteraceae bacterium]|nr:AAA family ATPase [Solirubrobacteraceae bacterium]